MVAFGAEFSEPQREVFRGCSYRVDCRTTKIKLLRFFDLYDCDMGVKLIERCIKLVPIALTWGSRHVTPPCARRCSRCSTTFFLPSLPIQLLNDPYGRLRA